ncbi:hypothetical protein GCM10010094_57240 [Streptomyces flaveus]|uniref:Uncharacterized protein n=1 Tax=Streptomyces flaveus TaxID=66370 RepID=A0A917R3S0_9ACTN|nr:hypothetical protein GCM10010094_57240 [Streptomyces flaveus]
MLPGQAFVTVIRYRPRSGHRAAEDTRITSYSDRGTTTTVRYRTVGLPSLVSLLTRRAAKSWRRTLRGECRKLATGGAPGFLLRQIGRPRPVGPVGFVRPYAHVVRFRCQADPAAQAVAPASEGTGPREPVPSAEPEGSGSVPLCAQLSA